MADKGAADKFNFAIKGAPALWVARFELIEGVSELFKLRVHLTSPEPDINPSDVVGKDALLTLSNTVIDDPRYVHGIVSRFEQGADTKKYTNYHAIVVPAFWRLTYRHDCRIFQNKKVPDIIDDVLKGKVKSYRLEIQGTHPAREYCVQYRESDFAFVSRLMEEEGIYYYFEHSDSDHVLVISDNPSNNPITGKSTLQFHTHVGGITQGEAIVDFGYAEEVRPGKVTMTDYNFKKPSLSLKADKSGSLDSDLEIYDYPGEYEAPGDGTSLAKTRLQEWEAVRKTGWGEGGVMRITPGYTFTLADHPKDSFNKKYLVTRARHEGSQPMMAEAGGGGDGQYGYHNHFDVMPASVPFTPARVTPRPTVKGCQTAIVTGPGGDEIHVDEHGRVKVQFHWDRKGAKDEHSSCWIRVSQLWAGQGWGAMWIPRIGHEVIVDFLEGDPDRPIITGRVYHGTNVPPYPLPAEKTKSTIKSNSSPGGGGDNEFRFEDKKGSEEIYLHGQKDWNIKIENDKNQWIGHDQTLQVIHDDTIQIGHDRTKTVTHDQVEQIGNNKSIKVGGDHDESIDGNMTLTVAKNQDNLVTQTHSLTVGLASTVNVGGALAMTVGAMMGLDVGGAKSENVGVNSSMSVGNNFSQDVGGDHDTKVSKDMKLEVQQNFTEKIDKEYTTEVAEQYTLKVGDGSMIIKKDGTITIKGKDITIKGDGKINIQASSKIAIKSDGPVDLEASGAVKVKGSTIDMN